MDHFLVQCPFNMEVLTGVGGAIGYPHLAALTYAERVYGDFGVRRGFQLSSLYLVSVVVLYYTWHARCLVSTRDKILSVHEVVGDVFRELVKVRDLERGRVGPERSAHLTTPITSPHTPQVMVENQSQVAIRVATFSSSQTRKLDAVFTTSNSHDR